MVTKTEAYDVGVVSGHRIGHFTLRIILSESHNPDPGFSDRAGQLCRPLLQAQERHEPLAQGADLRHVKSPSLEFGI
jgi:hypothetical protein